MVRDNCFAYVDKNKCYCLIKKNCTKCKFFKTKERARMEYMKNRAAALAKDINKYIDNYFYLVLR